jgi:phosphoglucomutase
VNSTGHDTELKIRQVKCLPFADQRMGTAGLRRKVAVFQQPHYLECFLQAVLDTLALPEGATVVLGGDGRFFNREAIRIIIRVACANGVRRLIVGRGGLLSTPAASNLIRVRRADGGFLLTASHNPGGPSGDFGVKFNMANGGQAPPRVTDAVYERSRSLTGYRIADMPLPDLDRPGEQRIGPVRIEVVDPVADYLRLMQQLFDFDAIAAWLHGGHRVLFDALHGITGPYARQILCETLGASTDCLLHAEPLADFGGLHPDPNPVDAKELMSRSKGQNSPDLLAASDGDGAVGLGVGKIGELGNVEAQQQGKPVNARGQRGASGRRINRNRLAEVPLVVPPREGQRRPAKHGGQQQTTHSEHHHDLNPCARTSRSI